MKKSVLIFTRLVGLLLIIWAVYCFIENKEYKSSYDTLSGAMKNHKYITLNYWKIGAIGILIFFYREIRRYLDYVKGY